jgi:hypothetical protein
MRKTSEFHSEPFLEEKKLGIPFQTIFGRENKPQNSIQNRFRKEKTSEFRSEPILGTENTRKSGSNHF